MMVFRKHFWDFNLHVTKAKLLARRKDQLRNESQYGSEEEIEVRARFVVAYRRAYWEQVIGQCPGTLFVVSADNENHDSVEYGSVPSGLSAPNLMAVGAVDRYGGWATFTNSNPERVRVYALGYEVESVVPDGRRIMVSGTSMSSPSVANLAGKLFSLYPNATPSQVNGATTNSTDAIGAPFNGGIVDEVRTEAELKRILGVQ